VVGFRCGKVENLGGRMRRMKKRGPNVLYDLNDLLFFLTKITHKLLFLMMPLIRLSVSYSCIKLPMSLR